MIVDRDSAIISWNIKLVHLERFVTDLNDLSYIVSCVHCWRVLDP